MLVHRLVRPVSRSIFRDKRGKAVFLAPYPYKLSRTCKKMFIHRYYYPVLRADCSVSEEIPASLRDALVRLMDGSCTLDMIIAELILRGFSLEEVLQALNKLDREGLLQESPHSEAALFSEEELQQYTDHIQLLGSMTSSTTIGWPPLSQKGLSAQATLKRSCVTIVGEGTLQASVISILASWGVGRIVGATADATTFERFSDYPLFVRQINPFVQFDYVPFEKLLESIEFPTNLVIYCPESFDSLLCNRINELCVQGNIAFIPFRQLNTAVEVGPLVIPRQTACYKCYEFRRQAVDGFQLDEVGTFRRPSPIGLDWLCLEAIKALTWITEPATKGHLWRMDILTGEAKLHPVLKLPRCPVCGVHRRHPPRRLWEEVWQ